MLNTVVTGCSSGFGNLIARTLARSGHRVFATMRAADARNSAAAQELVQWGEDQGFQLSVVELDVTDQRLPEAIESSIYFFCSEALTNVVKHARAGSASVRVALEGDRCTVEVRDDGIGGADSRPGTSGLIGLRDRIGALKGAIEVSSPAVGGTVLRAWIPLPTKPGTSEPEPNA